MIWDYQRLGIGTEEEGYALETEIGLFAMKREAVFRALEPFQKLDIEIDIVQLTPLALYNYLLFDQLRNLPKPDEYDPENPPESTVILSLGTDATDLVVTNGYKVWQRSIPLGGNHFTKALTKEMKLTFAKAEHLKRNATAAADPKAVFQAMRPVFNELLTQLQRSIGYFSNLERHGENRADRGLGQRHETSGFCGATCRKAWATTSSACNRSRGWWVRRFSPRPSSRKTRFVTGFATGWRCRALASRGCTPTCCPRKSSRIA